MRQHVDGHADDGQCHQWLAAHGIDIGERVGGGDAAEVVGIIDDRHEEIGGGDDGLFVVDAVDGGIVGRFGAHQQVGEELGRQAAPGQQGREDARGDLAAAAATVGEGGETGGAGAGGGGGHRALLVG